MPKSNTSSRQPVDKFVDGPVHVSIWQNDGVKGAFRAATVQLRYKDEKKGWQTGKSYGAVDLEHLESAAKEARRRIREWQQGNKSSSEAKPAA